MPSLTEALDELDHAMSRAHELDEARRRLLEGDEARWQIEEELGFYRQMIDRYRHHVTERCRAIRRARRSGGG